MFSNQFPFDPNNLPDNIFELLDLPGIADVNLSNLVNANSRENSESLQSNSLKPCLDTLDQIKDHYQQVTNTLNFLILKNFIFNFHKQDILQPVVMRWITGKAEFFDTCIPFQCPELDQTRIFLLACQQNYEPVVTLMWKYNENIRTWLLGKPIESYPPQNLSTQIQMTKQLISHGHKDIVNELWQDTRVSDYFSGKQVEESGETYQCNDAEVKEFLIHNLKYSNNLIIRSLLKDNIANELLNGFRIVNGTRVELNLQEKLQNFDLLINNAASKYVIQAWEAIPEIKGYFSGWLDTADGKHVAIPTTAFIRNIVCLIKTHNIDCLKDLIANVTTKLRINYLSDQKAAQIINTLITFIDPANEKKFIIDFLQLFHREQTLNLLETYITRVNKIPQIKLLKDILIYLRDNAPANTQIPTYQNRHLIDGLIENILLENHLAEMHHQANNYDQKQPMAEEQLPQFTSMNFADIVDTSRITQLNKDFSPQENDVYLFKFLLMHYNDPAVFINVDQAVTYLEEKFKVSEVLQNYLIENKVASSITILHTKETDIVRNFEMVLNTQSVYMIQAMLEENYQLKTTLKKLNPDDLTILHDKIAALNNIELAAKFARILSESGFTNNSHMGAFLTLTRRNAQPEQPDNYEVRPTKRLRNNQTIQSTQSSTTETSTSIPTHLQFINAADEPVIQKKVLGPHVFTTTKISLVKK